MNISSKQSNQMARQCADACSCNCCEGVANNKCCTGCNCDCSCKCSCDCNNHAEGCGCNC